MLNVTSNETIKKYKIQNTKYKEPTLFVGEAKLLNVTSNETIKTSAEQQHELHRNGIWFYFCDNSSSTD